MIFIPLILFLTGSLVYDHQQCGYVFMNRSLNDINFIEKALEEMPICNSHDRPRQRAVLQMFQTWSNLAYSHNIRYWISHKTLASYLQSGGISPYDQDIDISITAEDTPQLIELQKANYSSLYKLQIHPQWSIANISNRTTFPSEGIDFTMYNARFINQKNNLSINIRPMYTHHFNKNTLMFVQYLNVNTSILFPIEWIFPLEPCVISNIRVWCPAQSKRVTASVYEQKLMSLSCVNGTWINSNQ